MSDLDTVSITHAFNGDGAATGKVDTSQLDTQLGNLAAAQNDTKAALDRITDGANQLAVNTVGLAQLKPEVTNLIGVDAVQQLAYDVSRSMKLPPAAASAGVSTILPLPEAGKLLGWNATADALVNVTTVLAVLTGIGTFDIVSPPIA